MNGFVLIVLIIIAGFGLYWRFEDAQKHKKKSKDLKGNLNTVKNFKKTKYYVYQNSLKAIAIDETKNKLAFFTAYGNTIFDYKDILSSEIIEDDNSITKTARGSQIGGALLGGLVLGGVGAIVGGLSGKKYNVNKVKNIDLLIVVNNVNNPVRKINFLDISVTDDKDGLDKNSEIYKKSIKLAKEWHSVIEIIINKTDKEDKKKEKPINNDVKNNLSIADELRKLKSLLDDNLLTEEEFKIQKNNLLNN